MIAPAPPVAGGAIPAPPVPPPIAGAGVPAGPPAPPAPPPPTTYAQRFGQPELDPLGGDYARLYLGHGVTATNLNSRLYNAMLSGTAHPACLGYAYLSEAAAGPPLVKVFVNPVSYLDPIGAPATGYDNRDFTILGDIERTATGYTNLDVVEAPVKPLLSSINDLLPRLPSKQTVAYAWTVLCLDNYGLV